MYIQQLKKESARVKKCIRTTTMKRFQFDWGAREEENIRKWFFLFGCEFTLKKYAFDICNGLLLLLPALSFSLAHRQQPIFFFLSLIACCLPALLAGWLALWACLCMSFFLHIRFFYRCDSYSYTPKIKKKKTDEIFSMFLHDSMFSSFLPFLRSV